MQGKQMNGLPVISIVDGERLGEVERTYVDPAAKRVIGVAYSAGGGLFTPEISPRLDVSCIHSLGPGALTVDNRNAIHGETIDRMFADLTTLDDLSGRAVLTRGGTALGKVSAVDFDERTFRLTEFEVSRGLMAGTRAVSIEQVATIGLDYVIVKDDVWANDAAADAQADTASEQPQPEQHIEASRRPPAT